MNLYVEAASDKNINPTADLGFVKGEF